MKKRNKPILLATLLVVFVAAAIAMNDFMTPKTAEQMQKEAMEQQKHDEPKALGAPRTSDNKSAASSAASSLARKPMAMSEPSEGPKSIKKKTYAPQKQKPNESMTSGQWYSDEYGYKGKG